jgi:hypothetical protein
MGGTLGAFLGQVLFHHKTKKWKFQLVLIIIVVVQVGLVVWWLGRGVTEINVLSTVDSRPLMSLSTIVKY